MSVKSYQNNSRNLYMSARAKGGDEIYGAYKQASQYIAGGLVASPYAGNPSLTVQLLAELNDLIDSTTPFIETEFRNQFNNITVLGGMDSSGFLVASGIDVPLSMIDSINGVEDAVLNEAFRTGSPIDNKIISEKIWGIDKKTDLLKSVRDAQISRASATDLADEVLKYMNTGKGYYNAYRLAFTELTWGYESTRLNSARSINDEKLGFEVVIEQNLSPNHKIYDICDELKGTYKVGKLIPAIPRHPNCACVQRQRILNSKTRLTTYSQQLKSINQLSDEKRKFINTSTVTLV